MKSIIITILLCLVMPMLTHAEPNILTEANQFFSEGVDTENKAEAALLLDKALLRYEQLYRDHPSGRLAYNIGNTYYKLDNKPMALVFYKRAMTTIPGDENLNHNMQIVREELQLNQPAPASSHPWLPSFVKLQHWHILSLYVLFWITATIRLIRRRFMAIMIPGLLLFLCLAGSTVIGMEILQPKPAEGVITAPDTIARQGNGRSFEPSFNEPLKAGMECTILEKRGYWLRIQLNQGEECWIPARSCERV